MSFFVNIKYKLIELILFQHGVMFPELNKLVNVETLQPYGYRLF